MRILLVHNAYQQRGGEDGVVESELALLRERGNEVLEYRRNNDEIKDMPRTRAAADTLWSRRTVADIGQEVARFRPDVIHCHNTFPLISPSIYWAAAAANVPVVQTLHNFRLLCPQGMFLREGKVCEDCLGKLPLPAIAHSCYRNSAAQSAVTAGMVMLHRSIGTYAHKVTRYIALNEFSRRKFIAGGLPADRIVVKPNFVDFPAVASGLREGLLFVGRLSEEKGIDVLAQAAASIHRAGTAPVVRVAGGGPQADIISACAGASMLGSLGGEQVRLRMTESVALVLPSIWYEVFPRTLVEAYACGLPVIASRLGALPELVVDGETGLLFEPGSATDLAEKMQWALQNPAAMQKMGLAARRKYEQELAPDHNYEQLMQIYRDAIASVSA